MVDPERRDGAGPQAQAVTEGFYGELRRIAERLFASERSGHTLQPTAVVNEACLRMLSSTMPEVTRPERLALAARVLKQVLIDHSRAHAADKRGGGQAPLSLELDQDVLAPETTTIDFESIHAALERLRQLHERQAEVVTLRVFSGMRMGDIAAALGVSRRSVEADWTVARAWLRRELGKANDSRVP